MRNKNGITLIALIITIIVMLILVTLTINVAINGGLFNKAKEAQEKTQKATDEEVLLTAAMGTIDDKGDLQINVENMNAQLAGQNWTVTNNNGQTLKCKNNDNNREYLVNKTTGKVEEYTGNVTSTLNELAGTYLVVGNPPERQGTLIIGFDNNNQLILNNDTENPILPEYYTITENSMIITLSENEEMVIPYFKTSNSGIVININGIVFAKDGTTNFFTSNLSNDFQEKIYAADLDTYSDAEKIVFGTTTFDLYTSDKGDWNNENILHGTCGMLGNNVLIILDSSYSHGTYNARLLIPSNGNATLTSETNLGNDENDLYYIFNLLNE